MIEVVETNETMVFRVASQTTLGKTYRVDLTANNGFSECDCQDWRTRRWPAIKAGKPIGTRATLCRHGMAARNHFTNTLLQAMAKSESQP